MATPTFDLHGLFQAVDVDRQRRDLSWAAVAGDVGVAATTIRRMREAQDAEADGVLALIRWLGVTPEDFVVDGSVPGEPLRPVGSGYVRVDMELVARAAGEPAATRGRTRTTIQHLVEVAQHAGRPVASLTRLSVV